MTQVGKRMITVRMPAPLVELLEHQVSVERRKDPSSHVDWNRSKVIVKACRSYLRREHRKGKQK